MQVVSKNVMKEHEKSYRKENSEENFESPQ